MTAEALIVDHAPGAAGAIFIGVPISFTPPSGAVVGDLRAGTVLTRLFPDHGLMKEELLAAVPLFIRGFITEQAGLMNGIQGLSTSLCADPRLALLAAILT
jgi:hypothetical protein